MATKTITLTGAEVAVNGLDGANAHIRNDGADVIYAAKAAGITVGADGVLSIPAGQAATVYGISGTVYIQGTGSAQIISNDYSELPFKTSATSGGSGADEIARAAINAHSGNAEIHVTAEDKAKWNAVNYSNPNLLINPDFSINQRGESTYTGAKYTVDRWYSSHCIVSVSDGYITITKNAITGNQQFGQYIPPELFRCLCGKIVTFSVDCDIKVAGSVVLQYCADGVYGQETRFTDMGRKIRTVTMKLPDTITSSLFIQISLNAPATELTSVDLYSAKLELGGMATPFVPPDPATELAKCQRYFYRLGGKNRFFRLYGIAYGSNSLRFSYNLPVEMRTTPTLTCSPGNWRLCVSKIPYNGGYWNQEYGTMFAVDGLYSSPSNVHICVELDSSKTVNISEGDSVVLSTNPDLNSDGSQKCPGWLDFDAEL